MRAFAPRREYNYAPSHSGLFAITSQSRSICASIQPDIYLTEPQGRTATTEVNEEINNSKGEGAASAIAAGAISLDDPSLFINREFSWLRFNERVLEEARDAGHPMLEQVKFLAICGSNLDEFFMVRVAGLQRQLTKGTHERPADQSTPGEQLESILSQVTAIVHRHSECWKEVTQPGLAKAGIHIHRIRDLDHGSRQLIRSTEAEKRIFPQLAAQELKPGSEWPFVSNLSLSLAVVLRDSKDATNYYRVKVPTNLFPRLIMIHPPESWPGAHREAEEPREHHFVFLEDLVASNLNLLFPEKEIVGAHPFRITRNAEIEIARDKASDLRTAIQESLESRRRGFVTRIEVDSSMPSEIRDMLASELQPPANMVFKTEGPMGLADLWQLHKLKLPALKDKPFQGFRPRRFEEDSDMFAAIAKGDVVLYHPYDSFQVMVDLLEKAAEDPDVLAIRITLYRIEEESPVMNALIAASRKGKSVTALIELKAKFDEASNISWARILEQEGVHVIYGPVDIKVHAKLLMIIRKEKKEIARYVHISSGNYNSVTAKIYGDIGYLSADPALATALSDLFDQLMGYSNSTDYPPLLVGPHTLKKQIIARIEREIEQHHAKGGGHIAWKLNGLVDKDVIRSLYQASIAGVRIDLNCRGLCSLRPGVKGISENISVTSIVSRFLEHARIYYFRNGGDPEVLLGSSDMLPRNLERRVEVLFPVPDRKLAKSIVENILEVHLGDNVKARRLLSDGSYDRVKAQEGAERLDSQVWMIDNRGVWHVGGRSRG